MQQNIRLFTKIIFILAIIFCIISIVLPLSGMGLRQSTGFISTSSDMGIDLYTWGMHNTNNGEWVFYYALQEYTEEQSGSSESSTGEMPDWAIRLMIAGILMLIVFPMSIISIILGIFAVKNLEKKKSKASISAGAILIFGIIFVIIYSVTFTDIFNSLISSSSLYSNVSIYLSWSWGFFLMIISSILFIIGYFIQESLFTQKTMSRPQMFYCIECGNELEKEFKFCTECGNKR